MRDTLEATEARSVDTILARWREVERELVDATPGSVEAESLQAEASRLHAEYARLIETTRAHYAPEY